MQLLVLLVQAVITEKYGSHGCNVGEDGGFAPDIPRQVFSFGIIADLNLGILCFCACSLKEGLDFVKEAIGRTGYNEKIKIAIGVGATEFCIGDILHPIK